MSGGGLSSTGYLVARDEQAVTPALAGYRVTKVLVEEGARVVAGQALCLLDDSLLRAQIDQQTALVSQQNLLAQQAQDEARRSEGVQGKGILSEEAIQARAFKAQSMAAATRALQAQLEELKLRDADMVVRAPVAGLVLTRNVRAGDVSGSSASPMFILARDGVIEMLAQVPDNDLSNLHAGDDATVVLANGDRISGQVRTISPRIDQQTSLGNVRIRLNVDKDNSSAPSAMTLRLDLPDRIDLGASTPVRADAVIASRLPLSDESQTLDLRVGALATAMFSGLSSPSAAIPESAIRYDSDGASVMVVGPDAKVHSTPIKTGLRSNGYVELVDGPPVGTTIVQSAAALLTDGEKVRPLASGKTTEKP
jgi:HlyD family secretion protein